MPKFVVLRNAAARRTASGFDSFGLSAATAAARAEPRVETHDISLHEAVSIAKAPDVAAVAIPMPIKLVRQLQSEQANASAVGDAWGVAAVKADTSPFTGSGVTVSVLDTGIDRAHPAFAGVTIVENDFTGTGNGDKHGHGTHCAGTIFGRDVGGRRIGIARGVTNALIGKVLDTNGGGTSDMIFSGIQWALDQGADVISMSLGFDFPGAVKEAETGGLPTEAAVSMALEAYRSNLRFFDTLMQLVRARAAFHDTAVVVAASGNESDRPHFTIAASLPAAADGVVSVAALGQGAGGKFDMPVFPNTMAQLAAPGVRILSAKAGGGLTTMSGTSMACPHVAGVAALWWEQLRASGAVRPSADQVVHNLMVQARTNVLDPNMTIDDRGNGMVTAPQ